MADPHIQSSMDWLDKATVLIYRIGLTLAGPVVLAFGWEMSSIPSLEFTLICAAMCASSLHVYMKNFRLLLQFATWVGLACYVLGFPMIGIGGAFITLGGLCFKEYFCFRVPGLPAQPLIMALLWFSVFYDWSLVSKTLSAISALLFVIVAIAKWRMPLHFDIGDKSKYEI